MYSTLRVLNAVILQNWPTGRTGINCDGKPMGLPYTRRLLTYRLTVAMARSAASLQMAAAQRASV